MDSGIAAKKAGVAVQMAGLKEVKSALAIYSVNKSQDDESELDLINDDSGSSTWEQDQIEGNDQDKEGESEKDQSEGDENEEEDNPDFDITQEFSRAKATPFYKFIWYIFKEAQGEDEPLLSSLASFISANHKDMASHIYAQLQKDQRLTTWTHSSISLVLSTLCHLERRSSDSPARLNLNHWCSHHRRGFHQWRCYWINFNRYSVPAWITTHA